MGIESPDEAAKPPARGGPACRLALRILQLAVVAAAIVDGGLGLAYLLGRPAARQIPAEAQITGNSSSGEEVAIEDDAPQTDEASNVSAGKRWAFEFAYDQTEEEYARLLDTLNIELATPTGSNTLAYASHFTSKPIHRTALARKETRMYTSWSSFARRKFDLDLLRKAGVQVNDNTIVLQILPQEVVARLSRLEFAFRERQPIEIRRTRFKVISSGKTFDFLVTSQQDLRLAPLAPEPE